MPEHHTLRLTGWIVAANAVALLAAVALAGPVGDVARRIAMFCGLAR